MNWYRRNNKKRRILVAASILVVVVVSADVLSSGVVRNTARTNTAGFIANTHEAIQSLWESSVFETRRSLVDENAVLKKELADMEVRAIQYSIARAENRALRNLLSVTETRSAGVTARVVSRPPASPFGTFLIDIGRKEGIKVGDYVLATGGVMLGEIIEIGKKVALVQMITHTDIRSRVLIGETAAEMTGRSSGNAHILLPREVGLAEGAEVFLEENGLLIGLVGAIEKTPADALQEVFVYTPVNLSTVRFVYVISAGL